MPSWQDIGAVFLGGGVGSVLRLMVGMALPKTGPLPMGTLAVNLIGSLLIGIVAGWQSRTQAPELWRMLLIVGLLGGFTTFSAFSWENVNLLREGAMLQAALNIAVQLIGGMALCAAGYALAVR
jgi:CrcB protein